MDIAEAPALDSRYRTHLRLVQAAIDDAKYICKLRSDPALNEHISSSTPDVMDQLDWLRVYKYREQLGSEYYFVIISDGKKSGVLRLYDFQGRLALSSFSWGS